MLLIYLYIGFSWAKNVTIMIGLTTFQFILNILFWTVCLGIYIESELETRYNKAIKEK